MTTWYIKKFNKVKFFLFPWTEYNSARKSIRSIMKKIESDNAFDIPDMWDNYFKLTVEQLQGLYSDTFSVKASLEEKIKVHIFSITIGITIQVLALSLLFSDGIYQLSIIIRFSIFITGVVSVGYLLAAGYFSLSTISEDIKIYNLSLQEMVAKEIQKIKGSYAVCIELNQRSNTIRNNALSISFQCIFNGLVMVALFFILAGGVSLTVTSKEEEVPKIELNISPLFEKLTDMENRVTTIEGRRELVMLEKQISQLKDNIQFVLIRLRNFEDLLEHHDETPKGENRVVDDVK